MLYIAMVLPAASQAETLEGLISSALAAHPAIFSQQAQTQAARSGAESAAWQYYPTPSASIEKAHASSSDITYQGDNSVSVLRLQQPLWTGGRITSGVQKADASVLLSSSVLEETRQQIALRVIQSYGDWLSAHLKTQANEKNLATHIRLRDQVGRRIKEGASSESDMTLALTRITSIAAEISLSKAQRDIALARLGQLLGRNITANQLQASVASPRTLNADLPTVLEQALAQNPSIQKAQAQAKVQEATIGERKADFSPDVYLRAERQFGNYADSRAATNNRFFIGLNTRFGAGLSTVSNVEVAKSQYEAALSEVESQKRVVSEQVLTDYALASSSKGRASELKSSADAASQVADAYARQFLAGKRTWLDLMNAAREVTQTELQLADIQSALLVATWRLEVYTLGTDGVIGGEQ